MLLHHQIDVSEYVHPTLYTGQGFGSIFGRLIARVGARAARTGIKKAIQAGSRIGTRMARRGIKTALRSGGKVAQRTATKITSKAPKVLRPTLKKCFLIRKMVLRKQVKKLPKKLLKK